MQLLVFNNRSFHLLVSLGLGRVGFLLCFVEILFFLFDVVTATPC